MSANSRALVLVIAYVVATALWSRAGLHAAASRAATHVPSALPCESLVWAITHIGHGPHARGYSTAICGIHNYAKHVPLRGSALQIPTKRARTVLE
jgi:hypothetical protein